MSKMTRSEAGRLGAEKTNRLWRQRYSNNPRFCKHCESSLPYEKRHNKFCSHSCAASFNNLGLCRNKGGCQKATIPRTQICEGCGSKIHDKKCIRKYCSNSCHRNHEWQCRKLLIEKTKREESPVCAKRYLKETRGIKCEMCNTTGWCGKPVPLVMDHIDGNSENNLLDNLRLVCGNCDMQLPTYKSKNLGNGRHSRRKRYAEGKSY